QAVCPDDAELLFLEGMIRTERGDFPAAKSALLRLLGTGSAQHFASVADGLRGHLGRHQLAFVCYKVGEDEEAERLWHSVLADRPAYLRSWVGLGELYLNRGRWPQLYDLLGRLASQPHGGDLEAALLAAKAHLARQEFAAARGLLEEARARWPGSL